MLGRCGISRAALAYIIDGFVQTLRRHTGIGQNLCSLGAFLQRERQQQPLGGDVFVAGLFSNLLSLIENARNLRGHVELARTSARDLGPLSKRLLDLVERGLRLPPRLANETGGETFAIIEQHLEKVLGRKLLVAFTQSKALRRLNEATGAVGIDLKVHCPSSARHHRPCGTGGRRHVRIRGAA